MDTAPGWYSDPQMAGAVRYWDGERWTDQVAVRNDPPQPQQQSVWTQARAVTLGILAAVALLIVIGWFLTANSGLDCETENVNRALRGEPEQVC